MLKTKLSTLILMWFFPCCHIINKPIIKNPETGPIIDRDSTWKVWPNGSITVDGNSQDYYCSSSRGEHEHLD